MLIVERTVAVGVDSVVVDTVVVAVLLLLGLSRVPPARPVSLLVLSPVQVLQPGAYPHPSYVGRVQLLDAGTPNPWLAGALPRAASPALPRPAMRRRRRRRPEEDCAGTFSRPGYADGEAVSS